MGVSAARREGGFALLEVLIATVIAALALGVLFEVASTGGVAVHNAGLYEEAVSRAKSHLAALDAAPVTEGEQTGDDGGRFRWRITVTPVPVAADPNAAQQPAPASSLTLYAVEVAISWMDGGRPRQVVLDTMRLGRAEPGNG